jgi:hypothetical protein
MIFNNGCSGGSIDAETMPVDRILQNIPSLNQ